jgi:hypothetical protein
MHNYCCSSHSSTTHPPNRYFPKNPPLKNQSRTYRSQEILVFPLNQSQPQRPSPKPASKRSLNSEKTKKELKDDFHCKKRIQNISKTFESIEKLNDVLESRQNENSGKTLERANKSGSKSRDSVSFQKFLDNQALLSKSTTRKRKMKTNYLIYNKISKE